MKIEVKTGTIEDILNIQEQIPEFKNPHSLAEYERRFSETKAFMILIAEADGILAGFKAGYQKEEDGSFYSWMGAVQPGYRRLGIAKLLADEMEERAKVLGYTSIKFKTRNSHKSMLIFGISNGFNIIGIEEREIAEENRILLEKQLF
ncbi:Ribosomal protein S18 acetylase RimI [Pseudarcicella hirudinis]|uniref:Ribosomal protein S18 acetylase RimI n=1 Tax=Pseudarcicella hirudinis TaxID=1079859 RepID=A0A1I5S409_9BACT|nr:GNAT family N-acetyltransferase [Pseudarcicella hirudinis]SFP65427.1 Ribosomal protein S18 acetylase RimI [Pseudarcicella hirudinis]